MTEKRCKKDRPPDPDAVESPVDEAEFEPDGPAADESVQAALPTGLDMEAAMEEDIAGSAEGVSRRNPDPAPTAAYVPPLSSVQAEGFGAIRPRRSGLEEAEWFHRFRARLTEEGRQGPANSAGPESDGETTRDLDDPGEDEGKAYSETEE